MSLCRCTLERELSGINRFVKFFFSAPLFVSALIALAKDEGGKGEKEAAALKGTYPF